jgi:hypothetical protein
MFEEAAKMFDPGAATVIFFIPSIRGPLLDPESMFEVPSL